MALQPSYEMFTKANGLVHYQRMLLHNNLPPRMAIGIRMGSTSKAHQRTYVHASGDLVV